MVTGDDGRVSASLPATAVSSATAPTAPAAPTAATLLAGFRAELARLGDEVDRVRQDAGFQRVLDTLAQFWRYSATNQWLIRRARPASTRVAGRRVWERLGRTVRPGEAPIHILAPWGPSGFPFVVVDVFDVRQTRGRKLAVLDLALRGRTNQVVVLERAARVLGIRVVPLVGHPSLSGCSVGGEVQIRAGLSPRERVSVLAHELAHELLHQGDQKQRRTHAEEETEAEATAYVVLGALGLPSKASTYIAWRGGTGLLIARSLGRIQRAARRILEAGGARP